MRRMFSTDSVYRIERASSSHNKQFWVFMALLLCLAQLTHITYTNDSQSGVMQWIGKAASVAMIAMCCAAAVSFNQGKKLQPVFYWLFVYGGYAFCQAIISSAMSGLYHFSMQIALLAFAASLCGLFVERQTIDSIRKLLSLEWVFALSIGLVTISTSGKRGYIGLPVMKAVFAGTYFVFVSLRKGQYRLLLAACAGTLFYLVGDRMSCFLMVPIILLDWILAYVAKERAKSFYMLIFWAVVAVTLLLPRAYVWLYQTRLPQMQAFGWKYLGGNFFNGREQLWGAAFNALKGHELFGLGTAAGDVVMDSVLGRRLSTHNLYIYLMMQGGYCQLFIFYMFMRSIWKRLFTGLADLRVRYSAIFLIAIMLYMNSELSLLKNNIVSSITFWLVICFGVMVMNGKARESMEWALFTEEKICLDRTPQENADKACCG